MSQKELNVRILDYVDGEVKLTEWCEVLPFLKRIKTKFKKDHLKVYSYIFFMTYPSPLNPYFNYSTYDKEFTILKDLECDFDIEDPIIIKAVERLTEMYTLPSSTAYQVIAESLVKIASNIKNSMSVEMDAGTIKSVMTAASSFKELKKTFDETRQDLIVEEKKQDLGPRTRGGSVTAYDD